MCNSHCSVSSAHTLPPVVTTGGTGIGHGTGLRSRSRSRYCTARRFSVSGPSLLSSILLYSISETELQKPWLWLTSICAD